MFEELVEYKKLHKHTQVIPRHFMRKSPKLGLWVANQRQNFKKDKLLPINGLSFWIQSISYMGRTTSCSMDEHVCLKSLSSTRSNTKKILWYQKNMIRTPSLLDTGLFYNVVITKKISYTSESNWSFDEFDWFWMGSSYISGIQKNLDDHMFRKLVAYKKAVYKDTMVLPHRYKGG